jgi:potassium/hydrogen antiporter
MEVSYLTGLSWFALIFLAGLLLSLLAKKIRLPDVILLIALGMIARIYTSIDVSLYIPTSVLIAFSMFALIMIVFNSTKDSSIKAIAKVSPLAANLGVVSLLLIAVLLSIFTLAIFFPSDFSTNALIASVLFAILISGTEPDVTMVVLQHIKNKIFDILKFESILKTPLIVLAPILLIQFYQGSLQANNFLLIFLQQIMTGVGTGVILGWIIFSLIDKGYFKSLAPLVVIASALACFTLAEQIGGNGILAVATASIVFGKMHLREKIGLEKFTGMFTNFLRIIVFILLGLFIVIPFTKDFLIKSLAIFGVYLVVRTLSVFISLRRKDILSSEKLFMGLSAPKGISVATVTFLLTTLQIEAFNTINILIFAFIIYSIVMSSLINRFAYLFLEIDKEEMKPDK